MSTVDVLKVAEERLIIGWAAVAVEKNQVVTDLEGDQYDDPEDFIKAATDFMADTRQSLLRHSGGQVGVVLHSMPITPTVCKALNLDSGGRFGYRRVPTSVMNPSYVHRWLQEHRSAEYRAAEQADDAAFRESQRRQAERLRREIV